MWFFFFLESTPKMVGLPFGFRAKPTRLGVSLLRSTPKNDGFTFGFLSHQNQPIFGVPLHPVGNEPGNLRESLELPSQSIHGFL